MAMSMTLKWCRKNLEHYSQRVFDALQAEYPEVPMEVKDCVDVCGLCTDVPFVLRNDAIIHARDQRGLYEKLKQGMSFMEKPPLPGTYDALMAKAKRQEGVE